MNQEKVNINVPNKIAKRVITTAKKMGLRVEMITHGTFYLSNSNKRMIFAGCMPETTSAISYKLTEDKYFTNLILKKHYFPVLNMERYKNYQQAKEFLNKNRKIVVKPRRGIHGKGITVGINQFSQVKKALAMAQPHDHAQQVVLEKYTQGNDYRLLVIGYKKVFVVQRVPAFVIGDGKTKIKKLIQKFNQLTGAYHYPIELDDLTQSILKEQGFNFNSIPNQGRKVFLRKTANIKSGGIAIEMTEKISQKIKRQAIEIAKLFKLDIVGIDWISNDPDLKRGYFIELNAYPGILLHYYPVQGKSYDVAKELLNYEFFPDEF